MKKFIINTLLISLPLFVLGFGMEFLLRQIPNDYKLKNDYLKQHSNEIETLILGSSHSFYGIDPNYFTSKTFNVANVSQTLDYDYEIIKNYQDNFKNLKTIVLPISYFTLYGKLEEDTESWRVKNYTIYYGMNTSNKISDYSEVLSTQFKANLLRLGSYYVKKKSNITCNELGWGNAYTSEKAKDLNKTGINAASRHSKDITIKKSKDILDKNNFLLDSIVIWSKKRGIKIIFITPPAFESYRNNLNKPQLQIMENTIENVISKNKNCSYYNLLNDNSFIAKDYYDADHVSEIGAKKLSNIINEKVKLK